MLVCLGQFFILIGISIRNSIDKPVKSRTKSSYLSLSQGASHLRFKPIFSGALPAKA